MGKSIIEVFLSLILTMVGLAVLTILCRSTEVHLFPPVI